MSFTLFLLSVLIRNEYENISFKKKTRLQIDFELFSIYLHITSNIWSIMKDINRLKVILVEKKKTGKWLAEQLGKDPSTISKWCSNTIQPSLETLDRIAVVLGIDRRDLLNKSQF